MPDRKYGTKPQFDADFAAAPEKVREEVLAIVPLIAANPGEFGYFYLGNWDHTRWVDVGGSHALIWQPDPFVLLRLVPIPAGDDRPSVAPM